MKPRACEQQGSFLLTRPWLTTSHAHLFAPGKYPPAFHAPDAMGKKGFWCPAGLSMPGVIVDRLIATDAMVRDYLREGKLSRCD